MATHTIRLILGDQLNARHSWFTKTDSGVLYTLMEVRSETDYVVHHIQKVCAIFAAMRHFADELRKAGHRVHYISLNDQENKHNLGDNLKALCQTAGAAKLEYLLPDEYRVQQHLTDYKWPKDIEIESFDTEHFYTERHELEAFFKGKKTYLMESFYRHMRKKHNILVDNEKPEGGKWNFDAENRKPFPAKGPLPQEQFSDNDVTEIADLLQACGVKTLGTVDAKHLIWPVTRLQALSLLNHFCEHLLPRFGDYQDAMTTRHAFLYHSRLSFALNVKLISPKEVVNKAVESWHAEESGFALSQLEGFVRQILGWREYMRGIYWAKMPSYANENYFDHHNKLPEWYWTGETRMNCMKQSVGASLRNAYAHHIQRLMVTGNFALLCGIHPDEVDAWYLGIYIDAFEWVEITNTRGMSQFADGGIVGTKPYVSTANYINKMSNYCGSCYYKHSEKTGEKSCPFNSLYWHFHQRHRDKLEKNPRIGYAYRTWDKMPAEKRAEILDRAEWLLSNLDDL